MPTGGSDGLDESFAEFVSDHGERHLRVTMLLAEYAFTARVAYTATPYWVFGI